ncbi:hypothetical protein AGRA3207_007550 [Actinomadura graeca]|uniref:Uncharacterized protein n=1 Tax=Actinomadura graeca TaxID=2750812 RepID=A0ABX8R570_9ACTN|nr:hypothetical protein [Actinomadura graeca]QXJ25978.1 hypothetical protein AGRA3207_007550 [Actinomadura graeca]
MPSQPSSGRRPRAVNFWDDDFEPARHLAEQMGDNRNNIIERLLAHWLRRPGAELPERPPQEVIDAADAAWQARKKDIHTIARTLPCPDCGVDQGPCLMGKGRGKRPGTGLHHRRLMAATRRYEETHSDRNG